MDMTARRRRRLQSVKDKESSLELIYEVLGNPNKRRIIEFIGNRGRVSFTQLRRSLKMSVGNLYYNLDHLKGLVYQCEDKKYALTEEGKKVYKVLIEESRRLNYIMRKKNPIYMFYHKYLEPILLPEPLFTSFYNNVWLAILASITPLALILYASFFTNLYLDVLEYSELSTSSVKIFSLEIDSTFLSLLKSIGSWVIIIGFVEIVAFIMGSRTGIRPEFFLSLLVALTPLLVYPIIHSALSAAVQGGFVLALISAISYRLLQVFSIGFLTSTIAIYKEMSKDRAFIVVFLLFYLSYTLKFIS